MADELPDQNVIRVYRLPAGRWQARVGPDSAGLAAYGPTGRIALMRLAARLTDDGYEFDRDWSPPAGPEPVPLG